MRIEDLPPTLSGPTIQPDNPHIKLEVAAISSIASNCAEEIMQLYYQDCIDKSIVELILKTAFVRVQGVSHNRHMATLNATLDKFSRRAA